MSTLILTPLLLKKEIFLKCTHIFCAEPQCQECRNKIMYKGESNVFHNKQITKRCSFCFNLICNICSMRQDICGECTINDLKNRYANFYDDTNNSPVVKGDELFDPDTTKLGFYWTSDQTLIPSAYYHELNEKGKKLLDNILKRVAKQDYDAIIQENAKLIKHLSGTWFYPYKHIYATTKTKHKIVLISDENIILQITVNRYSEILEKCVSFNIYTSRGIFCGYNWIFTESGKLISFNTN